MLNCSCDLKGLQLKPVNKHKASKEKCAEVVNEKLQERPAREESERTSSESLNLDQPFWKPRKL